VDLMDRCYNSRAATTNLRFEINPANGDRDLLQISHLLPIPRGDHLGREQRQPCCLAACAVMRGLRRAALSFVRCLRAGVETSSSGKRNSVRSSRRGGLDVRVGAADLSKLRHRYRFLLTSTPVSWAELNS
jgi:hypothetical protein